MRSWPDFEVKITNPGTPHTTQPFRAPDKLTCLIVVEQVGGTSSTITVVPQHSGDGGRLWLDKAVIISAATFNPGAVTALFGSDNGGTSSLPLMRLLVNTAGNTPNVSFFLGERGYGSQSDTAESRLRFDGVVPSNGVYSEIFDIPGDAQFVQFHVNAMRVVGAGTLSVQLEHSNDEMTFTNVQGSPEISGVDPGPNSQKPFFGTAAVNSSTRLAMRVGRLRLFCNTAGDFFDAKALVSFRRKLKTATGGSSGPGSSPVRASPVGAGRVRLLGLEVFR